MTEEIKKGAVKLLLENGETIIITPDQVKKLIRENKQLRRTNKFLQNHINNLTEVIGNNAVELSEENLQKLLEELGVAKNG